MTNLAVVAANAAPVVKAASAATAASTQPLVIAVQSMPSGGALPWIQVFGTLGIALIAAGITFVMQRRQVKIAGGALKTAESKLRLDLFDKRYEVFVAARGLIRDEYLLGMDTENATSNYAKLQGLIGATAGASWLLDDEVETFLKTIAHEAEERYESFVERKKKNQQTWGDLGWDSTELEEGRKRMSAQLATLDHLFRPFMRIRHKSGLDGEDFVPKSKGK